MAQNKPKCRADILMDEIDKIFIKNGLNPPERVERTGNFIHISPKQTNESMNELNNLKQKVE